jgi:predicted methyltransferase
MRTQKAVLLILTCLLIALGASPPRVAAQQPAGGSPPWDRKNRDTWQRPEEAMNRLGIQSGSRVADVGCGDGYFTYHLASRVGPSGKVYAVDIRENQIQDIRRHAAEKSLSQIEAIVGAPDNPHLPTSTLDAVLVVDAYHEFKEYDAMLKHLYDALKPGGVFGVMDFFAEPGQTRGEYVAHHHIPPEMVQQEVESEGFHFARREADIPVPGAPWKFFYFLVFTKPTP